MADIRNPKLAWKTGILLYLGGVVGFVVNMASNRWDDKIQLASWVLAGVVLIGITAFLQTLWESHEEAELREFKEDQRKERDRLNREADALSNAAIEAARQGRFKDYKAWMQERDNRQ